MDEREIAQFSSVLYGERSNRGIADEQQSVGGSAGEVSQFSATLRPIPRVERQAKLLKIATQVASNPAATDDQI